MAAAAAGAGVVEVDDRKQQRHEAQQVARPQADLAPLMQVTDSPVALLAAPNLPVADAPALIWGKRSARVTP